MESRPDVQVMSLFDEETVPIEGGDLQWVPLRRRLGIQAFGTNAYRAERAGDLVVEYHVESPGQEEMYLVVRGGVRFTVGEEELDVPAGSTVFVARPELRRGGVALEADTVVLAVGGWPDRAYHSLPWEPIFLAQEHMRSGDWAKAAETLEREAGDHLDTGIVRFRLACCYAELGDRERAMQEARKAVEISPGIRERMTESEHLQGLPLEELS